MKRSRRRISRVFIALMVVAVVAASICVIRASRPVKTASNAQPAASLSTLSAMEIEPISATTQPAVAAIAAVPPIETSTPTSTSENLAGLPAVAQPASATMKPADVAAKPEQSAALASASTRPSDSAAWQKLLTTGSADGASAAPTTQPIVTGNGVFADAKARLDAGELLDARSGLNEALQSGKLPAADAQAARLMLADINQSLVFSTRLLPGDAYSIAYLVHPGDSLAKIAVAHATTWELLSQINHLDPKRLRAGSTIKVIQGPFFADVRKTAYAIDLYLGGLPGAKGSMYVTTFPVGLGKDNGTPTGLWAIGPRAKLLHPTYYPPEGGSPIDADDPKNPLGGYWIALTGVDGQAVGRSSYGIHGTIDPDSIGKQASLGCIRLRAADIAMVFSMMVEGKSMVRVEE